MADKKKKEDALNVEDALTQSEAFIIKNKKPIIGAIIAVVVIIAGIFCYSNFYKAPREKNAQAALFKGEQYFENSQYDMVLNGDSIGFNGLIKMADQYSGTKAANLANAYIGLSYAHQGQYQDAISYLDKFSGKDQMIGPAVKGALGNCYVQTGDIDKGISLLQAAAKEADNNTVSPVCLLQAGQLLMNQGRYSEAETAFQTIKDKYFNSYQALDIDRYIAEAQQKQASK